MASSTEVASLAGTWVGAGVGVIALFAFVGPLLIWLASRTDRQKTINALGRDNNGYISPGWHLGPKIYLWHRVRAPNLRIAIANASAEGNLRLDVSCLHDFDTQATWIRFGALVSSYGIRFTRGDNLFIHKQKSFLPVHPSWVYAVGLLGRYSSRRDRGHISSHRRARFSLSVSTPGPPRSRTPGSYRTETFQPAHELYEQPALYGITGTIQVQDRQAFDVESPVLSFHSRPTTELKDIEPEVLNLQELFLLSMGLLPLGDKSYASLMDIFEDGQQNHGNRSESDTSERSFRYDIRMSRDRERVVIDDTVSPPPPPRPVPYYDTSDYRPRRGFVIYRLNPIDADEEVSKFGQTFFNVTVLNYWGFTAISDTASERSVREIEGNSYVPADSEWVRASSYYRTNHEIYMPRSDAQQVALALLNLRWHPEGYLLGCQIRGPGMTLLTGPSHRLIGLITRVLDKYRNLSLSQEDQQRLYASLNPVMRLVDKSGGASRRAFRLMYQLDAVLEQLGSRPERLIVDRVIGILCLTNYEFLELVYQSIRNLRVAANATIQLDLRSTTLKVPSVFGVTQDFPVDMDTISPNEERNHETIDVSYTVIVLAALRSVLRSKMLDACWDAKPLLEMVDKSEDIILIH